MPQRLITSRLAARGGIHAADLVGRADGVGSAADAAARQVWARVRVALAAGDSPALTGHRVAAVLAELPAIVYATLRARLAGLAVWSHRRAVRDVLRTVPVEWLRPLAARRLRESREPDAARPLMEAGALLLQLLDPADPLAGDGELSALDLAAPLRGFDLTMPGALTADGARNLFSALLFPPPTADRVTSILDRLMPRTDWQGLTTAGGMRTAPTTLGQAVASGIAAGQTNRQIASTLLPFVDGSRTRAVRAARTYGVYVTGMMQREAHEGLGDLVIGWQVHSAGGENARHDHALRSGTVYYKDPKPGQVGVDVMPQPPLDRGGPHEDTKGLRHNCRCWLTPVLRPPEWASDPAKLRDFDAAAASVVADPGTYAGWFAGASNRQKTAAVGVRRLQAARDVLDAEPEWADLVDPSTGRLLSVEELRGETAKGRAVRTEAVRKLIAERGRLLRDVGRRGFLTA